MIPFADVFEAIKWLAVLYLCMSVGALAFVNAGQLAVLRYAVGKAVGLIGIAAITWILSISKILSFSAVSALLVIIPLLAITVYFRRIQISLAFKKHWRSFLAIEIIFISLFIVGVLVRAANPRLEGTEKMMDSAILSNLLRHGKGVPVDTWYSPDNINYYYFGQWIIALLAKLSFTSLAYAYNLGCATIVALSGSVIFALTWTLTKKIAGGFLGVFLVLFASNLHPFIALISGQNNYFFFNSGRFIEQVINEYPFYSITLGDLHGHYLSLMLATAFFGLITLLVLTKNIKSKLLFSVAAGGFVGLMAATNTFDVISCGLLYMATLGWVIYKQKLTIKQAGFILMGFVISSILFLIIFLTHFKPPVGGVGILLFKTPILHIFWQFGGVIFLSVASLILIIKSKILSKSKTNALNTQIAIIFFVVGLSLIVVTEFVYLKDLFHYQNPPYARANTVFKLWYSAWQMLAIAATVLVFAGLKALKSKRNRSVGVCVVIIILVILSWGTVSGINSLKNPQPKTINGLKYLELAEKDKLNALDWAAKNISNQPTVLQNFGEAYTTQSWFSSYSGLPTILGWRTHELTWRYSDKAWAPITARTEIIKSIYEAQSITDLQQTVRKNKINYILIGPEERTSYVINEGLFSNSFGSPVYKNSQYHIYNTD
jgi:uncharacterized membrane protein